MLESLGHYSTFPMPEELVAGDLFFFCVREAGSLSSSRWNDGISQRVTARENGKFLQSFPSGREMSERKMETLKKFLV